MKANVRNRTNVDGRIEVAHRGGRRAAHGSKQTDGLARRGLMTTLVCGLLVLTCVPASTQVGPKSRGTSEPESKPAAKHNTNKRLVKSPKKIGGKSGRRDSSEQNRVNAEVASNIPKPLAAPPSLRPYEFESIKFGVKGTIAEKSKGQAEYFEEELDGVKLLMVRIPAGSVQMGTPDSMLAQITAEQQRYCTDDQCRTAAAAAVKAETPQRAAAVPAFLIGKFEVTQAQWRAVAGMNKVKRDLPADPSKFKDAQRPVDSVSWEDAVEFCARLSQKTGRRYRLPTEAEWEYACRSETTTEFAFGEVIVAEFINFDGNRPYGDGAKGIHSMSTRPVEWGRPVLNGFGLSGMHGNVMEWCQDHWHGSYDEAPADASAWTSRESPASADRVVRGGAWSDHASRCRSAFRTKLHPRSQPPTVGLRVVMDGA